jgi:flagellar motor component MotA
MNSIEEKADEHMTSESYERISELCGARFHELYDDLVQDLVKYMEDEVNKIVDERERESVRKLMYEELSELTD